MDKVFESRQQNNGVNNYMANLQENHTVITINFRDFHSWYPVDNDFLQSPEKDKFIMTNSAEYD